MTKYARDYDAMLTNLRIVYSRRRQADVIAGKAWYPNAQKIVSEWAEHYGYSESTVACVIAAISPQCSWDRNLVIADDVLANRPVSIGGALRSNIRKAQAIRDDRADALADYFKSGPKVTAFALNLQGYRDAVTVDTHAVQAAYNNPEVTVSLKWSAYDVFARAYVTVAREYRYAPCDFQAIIWHTWKALYPWTTKQRVRRQYV